MLYVIPIALGAVNLITPVAVEHVVWIKVAAGTAVLVGCVSIIAIFISLIHPKLSFAFIK
jgi:hypothetical protein